MPSKLFSVRLDIETLTRLEERARSTGEPKSRLAQSYIEEGLRMERHPRITFREGPRGRRPAVVGGQDVWEIIGGFREGTRFGEEEVQSVATSLNLTPVQVQAAVDYYIEYRDEIDAWIGRNRELARRLEAEYWRSRERAAG